MDSPRVRERSKDDYRKMLEDGWVNTPRAENRWVYLANFVFGYNTYEGKMDELFARKAVQVCNALNTRSTFAYVQNDLGRLWYLMLMHTPFFAERTTWGTSIRGAWWDGHIRYDPEGLLEDGEWVTGTMMFDEDTWRAFIDAVIEFGGK